MQNRLSWQALELGWDPREGSVTTWIAVVLVGLFFALSASALFGSLCFFCSSLVSLSIRCGFQQRHLSGGNDISSGCFQVRRNLWVVLIVVPLKENLIAPPPTPGDRVSCCRELCPSLSSSRPVVLKVGFWDSGVNITWELVGKAVSQASQI